MNQTRDQQSADKPSPVIRDIHWSPPQTIVRRAKGSDNWPITWADDDMLYTAYGDGRGFEPFVPQKLSMGLARITGGPDNFQGVNLRSPTAERRGDGKRGLKASGMLMVDGVLYMLVRNADNSQLAWSRDHGRNWEWNDWKFRTSFGYPTFLNFGRNYAGARDDFVYIYSPDSDSAYERADRMVLARVPRHRLRDQEAYEYFAQRDSTGRAHWTADIQQRGAVFTLRDRCYRSSVVYSQALRRYLWCQTRLDGDPGRHGGFAIYDAPDPWGPWTVAYQTDNWDVGAGESCSLPTKWMSADGLQVHLVFSGDDSFSVRAGTIERAK